MIQTKWKPIHKKMDFIVHPRVQESKRWAVCNDIQRTHRHWVVFNVCRLVRKSFEMRVTLGWWIYLSFTVRAWESVHVSALMNSYSVTEYRPWQSRTDEMIQKPKHCPGSHHFSWRPRANISGGSEWWSEIIEREPSFPVAKQSQLKERKDPRRLNVLLTKQSAWKRIKILISAWRLCFHSPMNHISCLPYF